MSRFARMCGLWVAAAMLLAYLPWAGAASSASMRPATQTATFVATTTSSASRPAYGNDMVLLSELVDMYEPVPFAHKRHAQMAEMWNGCETCHHHTPSPTTAPATQASTRPHVPSKEDAAVIPACKSCHPIAAENPAIHMPSLKGAYHRQCLNCHREWMDSNACVICHAARPNTTAPGGKQIAPTSDDIAGRMHKPIPAPATKPYVARFTPVAGPNVLFRHDEHVKQFGIRCVTCHHRDSCATCHSPAATTAPATQSGSHPLKPGRTWRATHGPCASCHETDRCTHCHYQNNQAPPPPFDHPTTGQSLDKDHVKLACAKCHLQYKPSMLTCGEASCHRKRPVSFPADRPGPVRVTATAPATVPTTAPATKPATQPTTRPVIIKIRRGGL